MSLYLLKNALVIRFAAATSMPSLDAARAGPIPYIVPALFNRREFEKVCGEGMMWCVYQIVKVSKCTITDIVEE